MAKSNQRTRFHVPRPRIVEQRGVRMPCQAILDDARPSTFDAVGMHYRLSDRFALGFETRFGHISNAGIDQSNRGVNEFEFFAGVSWFF